MPWQVAQSAAAPGCRAAGDPARADLPVDAAQTRMLRQVDAVMESLQEKRQLAAGGNGRAWTRRRIGHQQADGLPDAADLVILAVCGDSRLAARHPGVVERRDRSGDAWRRYSADRG